MSGNWRDILGEFAKIKNAIVLQKILEQARNFDEHLQIWICNGRGIFNEQVDKKAREGIEKLIPRISLRQLKILVGFKLCEKFEDAIIARLIDLESELNLEDYVYFYKKVDSMEKLKDIILQLVEENYSNDDLFEFIVELSQSNKKKQ